MRPDFKIIETIVPSNSKIIDVGCGCGELLNFLQEKKSISARGIEINANKVAKAISDGVSVVQGDFSEDLQYYPDKSFDVAIMSLALQISDNPPETLKQLIRIADKVIISLPNFGYWKNRLYLGLKGKMPVTNKLSYQWYETPNIHFCTLIDFIELCEEIGLNIEQKIAIYNNGKSKIFKDKNFIANIIAEQGVFVLTNYNNK